MPTSTNSTASNDQCEHCHSEYSLIKRKKICAICLQSFCNTCAPREQLNNHSFRICTVCQLIASQSTSDSQLLDIKVKHLRLYLQAKDISYHTCTEKRELVDLIKQNHQKPFTRLLNQQTNNSNTSQQTKSGPFSSFQNTVSSFANQVNNFASNIQDYVSNTVSDAINTVGGDEQSSPSPQQRTRPNNPPRPQATAAAAAATPAATASSTAPPPRPPPSTSTSTQQRSHRKSLSEIHNEEKIEDLNIRELKEILAANFVDFKGCVEKNELMDKVRRLYRDRQNANNRAKELGDGAGTDTEQCKICMDAMVDCVFLDCGHMLTCVKCGKLLAECPICRSNIVRVVRVFKS